MAPGGSVVEDVYGDLLREQASQLNLLKAERGAPSMRAIEVRARMLFGPEASLPIATQSAAFAGRYVGLDKLMWLVRALTSWDDYGEDCPPLGRRAPELSQWRDRWTQITLARPKRGTPTASPAQGLSRVPISHSPAHFIWLLDCSPSMDKHRIGELNFFIREAIAEMRGAAQEHPTVGLVVRALTFSGGARWHIKDPVDIHDLTWSDIYAYGSDGACDMGSAFRLAARTLHVPPMPRQTPPPVLALVSGGPPTDDWRAGLRELDATPWGSKAVRIALPIGADADHNMLKEFLGNSELELLDTNRPRQVAAAIRWVAEPWSGAAVNVDHGAVVDDDNVW
ncbi:hypothetical protein [Streptomyces sp. NPDC005953]|uniref:vWA domain-containing protein n=1 Tax=Streptomyces sp. NPDC005953 TaxID=3156719 RepID=UPI0033F0F935